MPIISVTVRDEDGARFAAPEEGEEAAAAEQEIVEVEGVFVLRQGEPIWVPVTVGIVGDRYFEIVDGLEEGEQVISGPYAAIRDLEPGSTVRLAPGSAGTAVDAAAPAARAAEAS